MSNPDSSTPSIQARNLAVKPAGMTWEEFTYSFFGTFGHQIALAYAADLDKADKVGREALALLDEGKVGSTYELLRDNLLPDPQPTLYQEFITETVRDNGHLTASEHDMLKFVFDWITKRELAKEQDRG